MRIDLKYLCSRKKLLQLFFYIEDMYKLKIIIASFYVLFVNAFWS